MDEAGGLGPIAGFVPDERSQRVAYASDGLLFAGLVIVGAAVAGASTWWTGLIAVLAVVCLFARPSGSVGSDLDLPVSASIVGATLLALVGVGWLATSSGVELAFALGGVAVGAVGLALAIVDRRRDRTGWTAYAGGLQRTDETGATVASFAWSEVASLTYRCSITTVPVAGGPLVATHEKFGIALLDGAQWTIGIHGGGVPTEVHRMGRPHDVSTAILAGIGDSQLGPANQAIDSGDTVPFGPLSVNADGLVTPGGPVAWSELLWVRIDDWCTRLVYNPNTERVDRFIRIFFGILTVADPDGRPPRPSRWDLPHVPAIDVVRRVAVAEGARPEPAEITCGDWQLPNLPTLLRLLRQHGKLPSVV